MFHESCLNKIMQGPLREDLTRISTRSSVKGLYRIMQGPRREEFRGSQLRPTFCARLRSRNATRTSQRDASRSTKYRACHDTKEVQPKPAKHFARACAIEMHMEISQEPFYTRILRKNARPKIGTHVFCEPAQSKCTWTCQKSQLAQEFTRKIPRPDASRDRDPHFARACETHMDTSQGPSDASIYKKNAAPEMDPQTATHTLREPAQLKCTWTKHKSHFVPEFTGKKLEARFSTLIKHRPLPLP